jgi:hypothetical protein
MKREDTAEAGLIEEKNLSNRMRLRLYDHSRRLAADRWLIRLHGEAQIIPAPEFLAEIREDDPELLTTMREQLGAGVVFTLDKERRFVAEEEKQEAFTELLSQVNNHMLAYLASPTFPEKLFRRRREELKARLLIERERARCTVPETEEEEGAADFSFCLRDRDQDV